MATPQDPEEALKQGEAHHDGGRWRMACAAFEQAARRQTLQGKAQLGWARALLRLGNVEQAMAHFEQALEADPERIETYGELVETWRQLLAPEAAAARIERCARRHATAAAQAGWASFEHQRGRTDAALAAFEQAAGAGPLPPEARHQWASALLAAGRRAEAVPLLRALVGERSDPRDRLALGDTLQGMGDSAGAAQAYVEVLDHVAANVLDSSAGGQALADAITALMSGPGTPAAQLKSWGRLLLESGRAAQAVTVFERQAATDPTSPSTTAHVQALIAGGRMEDALRLLAGALAAGAPYPDALVDSVAPLLSGAGVPAWARSLAETLADSIPALPARAAWSRVLEALGAPDSAWAMLERVIQAAPADREFLRAAGLLQLRRHRPDEGLELLMRVLSTGALDWPYEEASGFAADRLPAADTPGWRRFVEALLLAPDPVGDPSIAWADWLASRGEAEAATLLLDRVQEPSVDGIRLALARARVAVVRDRSFEVVEACARVVELSGGFPYRLQAALALFRTAAIRLEGEGGRRTIEARIAAIDGADAYRDWALTLGMINRRGAELQNYRKALELAPGRAWLRAEYAFRLVVAGQVAEGMEQHERAAAAAPEEPFVHHVHGRALADRRRFADAIEALDRARRLGHGSLDFDCAVALDGLGRREEAVARYRADARGGPDLDLRVYGLHNIASLRQSQGDYAAAHHAWKEALAAYAASAAKATERADASYFSYYAFACQAAGQDLAVARTQLEAALACDPRHVPALVGLAWLCLKQIEALEADKAPGLHAQAREAEQRALAALQARLDDLDTGQTRYDLAQVRMLMSEPAAAIEHLRTALAKDPDHPEAWVALAQAHAQADDPRAALEACRRAVSLDPDLPDLRCALAEACRRNNDLDRAESEFRRILTTAAGHVDARIGLGRTLVGRAETFVRDGKATDAEYCYQQALDHFGRALAVAGKPAGSRRLTSTEKANLAYMRGYARVQCFETQTFVRQDAGLLDAALVDFAEVPQQSANFHRAHRARLKILERTRAGRAPARWGSWIVVVAAVLTLVVANVAFLIGKPGLVATATLQPQAIPALRAASAPAEVLARAEALVRQGELPKADYDPALKAVLGENAPLGLGAAVKPHQATGLAPGWQASIEAGYYGLLSFGALLFIVAGLYLQQLSKLKIGGIELEKSSESAGSAAVSLGIGAPEWQPSIGATFATMPSS